MGRSGVGNKGASMTGLVETFKHIGVVRRYLGDVIRNLVIRADRHDHSKTQSPEVEMFEEFTPKLAATTYGSPEYEGFRKAMGPALAHHYANNRHHPEHFKNGINDMTLLDLAVGARFTEIAPVPIQRT